MYNKHKRIVNFVSTQTIVNNPPNNINTFNFAILKPYAQITLFIESPKTVNIIIYMPTKSLGYNPDWQNQMLLNIQLILCHISITTSKLP